MSEQRETGHVLIVEINDGEREYAMEHLDGCPMKDMGGYQDFNCMTAAWLNDAGFDDTVIPGLNDLAPGRYMVESWYQPFYWCGSEPVDPDGGIDIIGPE